MRARPPKALSRITSFTASPILHGQHGWLPNEHECVRWAASFSENSASRVHMRPHAWALEQVADVTPTIDQIEWQRYTGHNLSTEGQE
jgi:hypothetical protein